ncbi:Putative glycosyltransferase EpsH [Candidatus Hepatincola sp. Av]
MKVSVIVPVYNTANYLYKNLTSIINNSFTNIEILCINDASTDNSLKILQEFQCKDSRIKIVNNNKNMGLAYTKQVGLDKAIGEYIMVVDSDDFVSPNFIQIAFEAIEESQADIVFFQHAIYPTGARADFQYNMLINPEYKTSHQEKALLHLYAFDWAKIYKKQLVTDNNIKYLIVRSFEDIYFNTCLLACAKLVQFIPKTLYYYYIHERSITNTKSIQTVLDLITVFTALKNYLTKKNLWNDYKEVILLNKYKKVYSYYICVLIQGLATDNLQQVLQENSSFEELLSIRPKLKGKIFFFMKRILKPEITDFFTINYLKYMFHISNLFIKQRFKNKNLQK